MEVLTKEQLLHGWAVQLVQCHLPSGYMNSQQYRDKEKRPAPSYDRITKSIVTKELLKSDKRNK